MRPCRRSDLPLLSVTYEHGKLPSRGSQNRWEEAALARVLAALPEEVRLVVLDDRGFGRIGLLEWLQARGVDYVLRLRRKLGQEGLRPGRQRWHPGVRYGTYHDRPRDLVINLACSRYSLPACPDQARRQGVPGAVASGPQPGQPRRRGGRYRQRMWTGATVKDCHAFFGLDQTKIDSPAPLGGLRHHPRHRLPPGPRPHLAGPPPRPPTRRSPLFPSNLTQGGQSPAGRY